MLSCTPPRPQMAKNPLIAATFSCAGPLDLRPASVSSLLMTAFSWARTNAFVCIPLDFPLQQMELQSFSCQICPVWRGPHFLPSLHPDFSLTFKVYEDHRFLHPPLADPASSVKPADHNSAGKEENHCRLIRKSSSVWMMVGMFVPPLLSATKAAGLLSAALFLGAWDLQRVAFLAHWRSLKSSYR